MLGPQEVEIELMKRQLMIQLITRVWLISVIQSTCM